MARTRKTKTKAKAKKVEPKRYTFGDIKEMYGYTFAELKLKYIINNIDINDKLSKEEFEKLK
ncbi:MAG: hypothetical protein VZR53_10865 [Prevotella sp.]|nr:hypothetical protein [Prevotella sp.]